MRCDRAPGSFAGLSSMIGCHTGAVPFARCVLTLCAPHRECGRSRRRLYVTLRKICGFEAQMRRLFDQNSTGFTFEPSNLMRA